MLFSLNRLLVLAAVGFAATAVGIGCSSSSSPPSAPSGDASTVGPPSGEGGAEDAPEEPAAPTVPCDAAISLPTGSAAGGACGDCLQSKCMAQLAICKDDCTCVTSIECLAVNAGPGAYGHCMEAMAALGAGDNGLTMVAGCIAQTCTVCNEASD